MVKVTYYNLSVTLETSDSKLQFHIREFLRKYYTSKQLGFGNKEPDLKIYVGKMVNCHTYQFHYRQFIHLTQYLKDTTDYTLANVEKEDLRTYNELEEDYKVREGWKLRENQVAVHDFLISNPTKSKLVPLQTGYGKAQPLTSKIKTPDGWILMGDIKVGDLITTKDGTLSKVNGVYPQGITPVYKITFIDGRSCEASDGHLWKIYKHNKPSVVTTIELLHLLKANLYVVSIDLPDIEQFSIKHIILKEVDIDMLLDIILNSSHATRLTILNELLEEDLVYEDFKIKRIKAEETKCIANQIVYLVRSLGGIASITEESTIDTTKYIIEYSINPSDKLILTDVKFIGYKETQCISIDHKSELYITDDFIVTHNTSITLISLATLKKKTAFVLPPFLIEKWVSDIANIHDTKTTDVMVVQGYKALSNLIEMAKDGDFNYKYVIISSRTFQEYIAAYEGNPELCVEMYGCSPLDLFPLLGIGIMVNDETHMAWHALYRIIIYSNVKYQIGLSATLISDDQTASRLHKVVYPSDSVFKVPEFNRYIDVYSISYTIHDRFSKLIRSTNYGSNNYSHTAFEMSLLKHKFLLEKYMNIILSTAEDYYFEEYMEKDKLLIFVSTIKMATALSDLFKEKYPTMNVQRYCEDDSYEDMLTADIIVSTIGSIGVGIDIPNLRVSIMTVSVSSSPTNIQTLGRLRKLPDRDVKFCYLFSPQIGKQKQYHIKRVDLFRDKVASVQFKQSRLGMY